MLYPLKLTKVLGDNYFQEASVTGPFKIESKTIETVDGLFKLTRGVYRKIDTPGCGDIVHDIFMCKYDPIKIVVVDDFVYAFVDHSIGIDLIKSSVVEPEKYVIKYKMMKNRVLRQERIQFHKPKTLESTFQIPRDPFVTIKMDGITVLVGVLKDFGIRIYDAKLKQCIWSDMEYRSDKNIVFGGEYLEDHRVYLFMEMNDKNIDFKKDLQRMTTFEKAYRLYNPDSKIHVNYIEIGNNYKAITRKLLERKTRELDSGVIIPSDGLVYGSISTKEHYKWKPMNTVDFYVVSRNRYLNLYVGNTIKNALALMRKRTRKIKGVKFILGSGAYIKMFYTGIQYDDVERKYNGKIVEFSYNGRRWIPIKIREDKIIPNNIRTVQSALKAILNPIDLSELI